MQKCRDLQSQHSTILHRVRCIRFCEPKFICQLKLKVRSLEAMIIPALLNEENGHCMDYIYWTWPSNYKVLFKANKI